jgi:hypothetical protein
MQRILSVLFYIFATTAITQAQSLLYFPQVADGGQSDGARWGTIIAITNPAPLGTGNSAGTLNFIKDDGTPLIINWQNYGGQGSDLTNSPSPSIHFQLAAGQTTVFIAAGELGQSTTSLQTGFAKLDGGPFSATAIFSEFGPGGGRIAQAGVLSATPSTRQEIIAIAPGASDQLFPNAAIGGQLRFTSDVPIVATALLFQNNGQFATFPVFPLP